MSKLVELSSHEVLINFTPDCKCRTTIRLTSLHPTAPVAFKLQTSSPHKFLVNPPTGLVPPLSFATFQVILKPQSQPPHTFPRSPADRFLLKTAPAPELMDSTDHPAASNEAVNRWFNSDPGRPTRDVKLKVYFVGPYLLAHAVGKGDVEAVRGIIKRHRSVVEEMAVEEAESLRRVAAGEVLGLLMDAGLRVVDDDHVEHPIVPRDVVALELDDDKGHNEVAKIVLEQGEAVLHAARRGDLGALESLLENGAAANFCDQYGLTALHVAAIKGIKEAVAMLVEFGADVECRDAEGHTPLHLAVEGENIETVEVLINRGADMNAKTNKGATSLYIAKLMEYEDIAQLLVDKGA